MNILFLDIDGVLNHTKTKDRTPSGFYGLDDDKVSLLKTVTEKTNCKIVLSSTWRKKSDMIDYIKSKGIEIFDITPNLEKLRGFTYISPERGLEIDDWLKNCNIKVKKFVIVDDDDDMAHLKEYLVQTNFREGLTNEKADEIVKMFGF
jgi:histidinol phosphatase-like enzyme